MKDETFRSRLARIIQIDKVGNDKYSRAYDWYMLVIIGLSLVPLMVENDNTLLMKCIEWVTIIAFIIDFVCRCYAAPVMKKYEGKHFFRCYPFTFMGLVDFMSILPILTLISYKFTLFRLFRLVRILALFKYTRYTDKDKLFIKVIKKRKNVLFTLFLLTMIYIFITALVMYNVEPHLNPTTGEKTFTNFFDALYWSTVTLTTVGYGDLCPVSVCGRAISMISSLFGIGLITAASGALTSGFIEEIKKQDGYIE